MTADIEMDYELQLKKLLTDYKNKNRKILLFGCGKLGRYAKQAFDFLSVTPYCFLDNNTEKHSSIYQNLPIISPRQAFVENPDAWICLCMFSSISESEIKTQLTLLGFKNFIGRDMLIYLYLHYNIKPVGYKIVNNQIISTSQVNFIITEKCSLKCKYCMHLIPYRNNPVHYNTKDCITSLNRACDIISEINNLVICGGEAFTHPNLIEICQVASNRDEIKKVSLLSNGTIIPSDDLMVLMATSGKFRVVISDYGTTNYKIKEIYELCKKFNVAFEKFLENSFWYKPNFLTPNNRSESENLSVYCNCNSPEDCPAIIDGKIYKCVNPYILARMGLLPQCEDDCVNLLDYSLTIENLKENMIRFVCRTKPIEACDFCGTNKLQEIPKAEQITDGNFNFNSLIIELLK